MYSSASYMTGPRKNSRLRLSTSITPSALARKPPRNRKLRRGVSSADREKHAKMVTVDSAAVRTMLQGQGAGGEGAGLS